MRLGTRRAVSRGAYAGLAVVVVAVIAVGAYAALGGLTPAPVTSTVVNTQTQTSIVTTTASATLKPVKVALVMEGPQLDGSFNQIISADLATIANSSKGTVTASYIDNINPSDFVRVGSTYGTQGYDLVVADSNDYATACGQVAPLYPKTNFGCYGGSAPPGPNLGSFVIWTNEASYAEGYLAGLMTHTGKVGDILAFKSGSQIAFSNGFYQGVAAAAKSLNKSFTVINAFTNTFTDPATGQQAAQSMLSAGVDVITEDASAPGAGMQNAVKVAYKNSTVGPFAMGAFVNQNSLGPFMISSTPWDFTASLNAMIKQTRDGTFGNQVVQYFMHDGDVSVVMSNTVPAAVQAQVNAIISKINKGTLLIPLVSSPDLMPSGTATVP